MNNWVNLYVVNIIIIFRRKGTTFISNMQIYLLFFANFLKYLHISEKSSNFVADLESFWHEQIIDYRRRAWYPQHSP